jgi:hypothetical protein
MQQKTLINVEHEIIDPSTITRLSKVVKSSKTKWKFGVHLSDGKEIPISSKDETELRKTKGEVTSAWLGSINGKIQTIGQ